MIQRSASAWRSRLLAFVGLFLLACGGGGGTDVLPDVPPGTTVRIAGRVLFGESSNEAAPVLEAEPNDSPDAAHRLGEIRAGDRIVVHGHTTAVDDSDPFDGFQLTAPERVRVTATLEFPLAAGIDFDMGVFDLLSFQFVETFLATTAPEVGVFHAKGTFDVVVNAYAGEGDYVLTIAADPPFTPIPEREPNNPSGYAQYLGEMRPGDGIQLAGSLEVIDANDGVLVGCPDAIRLDVNLGFTPGNDYDVHVYDATTDIASPVALALFESANTTAEVGFVDIAAGTLVYVEVVPFDGTGPWSMTLSAGPSGLLTRAARLDAGGRLAPLAAEASRWKGVRAGRFYGRPRHEFVPGQALVGRTSGSTRVDFALAEDRDPVERGRETLARMAALRGAPGVRYAEPNYVYRAHAEPDDTYYNLQWHYDLIHLPEAWDVTTGNASVIVAVIDTGRTNHPDLAGRQVGGYDFISDAANAGDGNGRDPDPTDVGDGSFLTGASSFHGTHVAGTIGATTNNGRGVAGATWVGAIMHLRVLGKDGGTIEDIAEAIRYAARLPNASGTLPAQRAHVINMSLGGGGYTQTLQDAITAARNAGVTIFASAGNEASSSPSYPAAHTGVISVVAVDVDADLAPYSNFGTTVDIAAPGGDTSVDRNGDGYPDGVLSTMYDDTESPAQAVYKFYQGTSMACPHAAGVAALVLAIDPTLTPADVELLLTSTAEDLGTLGRDNSFGHGLIDAHRAVLAAQGGATGSPVLFLAPTALNFGGSLTILDATISNGGADFLDVTGLVPMTQSGGSWLSASLGGSGDATRNASSVRVAVSRSGLADGSYSGRVIVQSNGGTREVQVLMAVGAGTPPPPDVDIYVLAIDPDTYETVAELVVNPTVGLGFSFNSLPPGRYLVAAGSDVDDDGYICDEGEYCGWYPVLGQPVVIDLAGGESRTGVDFVVAPDEGIVDPSSADDRLSAPPGRSKDDDHARELRLRRMACR